MGNYLNIIEFNKCTGCGACQNICPASAISMKEDKYGYLYPIIDKTKCTNCGLCKKACPILNDIKGNNNKSPECFAVMAPDNIRSKSSSGGMFTLLAQYVLNNNGYVCGAAYEKDFSVHHIIINNIKDLDKLRGSKYIFGTTDDCYSKIKQLLNDDKLVLFTGCPCQIAGLKGFLRKDYNNLITMELLCHGAPSYKVFRKYLDENFDFEKIKKINFRDKKVKWRSDYLTIEFDNNEIKRLNKSECSYEAGFHAGLFNRSSCAPCHFARLPRLADFTVADWWGINKFAPEMNDTKGTSLVLINNKHAKNIFNQIKNDIYKIKKISLNNAKKSCNVTIFRPLKHHERRHFFYINFEKLNFNKNVQMCLDTKNNMTYDVGLVGVNTGNNYGTQIQYYSLYKTIENLGYSVLMINHPINKNMKTNYPNRFKELPYELSAFPQKVYKTKLEMIELNKFVKRFIVGSDQFFRAKLYNDFNQFISLDWVLDSKYKAGFSISFGLDKWKGDNETKAKLKYDLQKFDRISTREFSGIKLLENEFGVNSECTLEPVLIADKNIYSQLAEKSLLNLNKKYIFAYILDNNKDKEKYLDYISKTLNLEIKKVNNDSIKTANIYIEDWLKLFKDAELVITDSFHGICFSIIFGKEFLFFVNPKRGSTRFDTLIKLFDIKDRKITSIEDLPNKLNSKVNYEYINENLPKLREKALDYLKLILSEEKEKPHSSYDNILTLMEENNHIEIENIRKYITYSKKSYYYRFKYFIYKILLNFCNKKSFEKIKAKKYKYKEIIDILNLYE